jgi:hypothetical protein
MLLSCVRPLKEVVILFHFHRFLFTFRHYPVKVIVCIIGFFPIRQRFRQCRNSDRFPFYRIKV